MPTQKDDWRPERHQRAHDTWADKVAGKKRTAQKNAADAASRSPLDQIKRLDKRFGEGVGAKKERARLERKIGLLMCGHHYNPVTHPYLATECLVREDDELREERETRSDDFSLDRLDD